MSGNDICAVKLSAITQLFKSATRVDGLGMRSSCCYLLVNTPLVECLVRWHLCDLLITRSL